MCLCVCVPGLRGAGDRDQAFRGPGVPAAGAREPAGRGEGDAHAAAPPGDRRLPAQHRHSQGEASALSQAALFVWTVNLQISSKL